MPLQLSAQGLRLMQLFESFRPIPYLDSRGIWTVGYGHVLRTPSGDQITKDTANCHQLVVEAMQAKFGAQLITQAQADQLMQEDLVGFVRTVNANCPSAEQCQFDAMVSLAYNIGGGNFATSSVRRYHNSNVRTVSIDIAALCAWSKGHSNPMNMAQAFAAWPRTGGQWELGLFRRRLTEAMVYRGDDPASAYRIMQAFHD